MASCPVFASYRPLDPEQLADPYTVLRRARQEAPVFFIPEDNMWCVTRYEDVLAVIKDTATYSNSGADEVVAPRPKEYAHVMPDGHPVSRSLHDHDPPTHTRLRKLAQKAFTRRHADARENEIRAIANRLIDGFASEVEVDLVGVYSSQIPSLVIAPIMGAPSETAQQLKKWNDDFFIMAGNGHLSEERNAELWASAIEFDRFIRELVEERRADPRDDLTSDLIRATTEDGSPSLTDWEVICIVAGLIAAGADTTNGLIANAVDLLLSEPEQWDAVKRDPSLVGNVVEETLRIRCPVRGQRRVTTRSTTLAGVTIPEGAVVYIHAGSANRDDAVFEEPDRFDLHRANIGSHLGLGIGIHFCLGAPLARLEARVAIECLIERVPDLRKIEGQTLEWAASTYVPALLGLQVALS